jgi:hypothetical protein
VVDHAHCQSDTQFANDSAPLADRPISEGETTVNAGAKLAGVKHTHKNKSYYAFSKTDEALTIESCGSPRVPLRGQLLDQFVGWRIKPDVGVNSGVLGRVRVRDDWIELIEPEHHAGHGAFLIRSWAT